MKRLIIISVALMIGLAGSIIAQTSTVSLGTIEGALNASQLSPGPASIEVVYTAGDAPSGFYGYSSAFIIHGDADWQGVRSQRTTLN